MRRTDGTFVQDIQCIITPTRGRGGLFISNLQAASNPHTLQQHAIGAVVSAARGHNLSEVVPKTVDYFYIPAIDHETFDLSVYFGECADYIERELRRTNVLVHCLAGVSRSATLVLAYLIAKCGMSFAAAHRLVKARRSIIHPNAAFIQQLIAYQNKCGQQQQKENQGTYDEKLRQKIGVLFQSKRKDIISMSTTWQSNGRKWV